MPDWRTMFDNEYLGAWDLDGREVTVKISKVEQGTLTTEGNKKARKPVVHLDGKVKKLVLNKTNCKTLQAMFGVKTEAWVGQSITLFGVKTQVGREKKDGIRIKNQNREDDQQ